MEIRADFSQPAFVTPDQHQWVPSPMPGVDRMMLDRVGNEVARATSLVRYAPGSTFSPHTHDGGEEIYVMAGEFGDEHGLYAAGTYLRNPIGTSHTPKVGAKGALIWVKLHQFDRADSRQCVIPEAKGELHRFGHLKVDLQAWQGFLKVDPRGDEVFLLKGSVDVLGQTFPAGSWIRLPAGFKTTKWYSPGALLLRTRGHLETI